MTAKQKNARGFRCILQNSINASDKSWSYTVSLPDVQATNKANLIKAVSVIASSTRQEIQLRYESAPSNRVTKSESLDKLMLISFADFRLQISDKSTGIHKQAPARESAEYVSRLLNTGIILNGVPYYFFGHSNSQLKSRSCFNLADTKDRISEKINAMGDFSKLKTVAKKAKRLGLLFSSAEAVFENLSPERCEDIPDVLVGDYNFTDGCGIISMHLAKELARRRSIVHRNERYLPSVFQIRYRGYKGVLSLEPSLGPKLEAKFRESMLKFKDAADLSFSVVAYSKPYTFGYLNDQIVLLLSALGISNDVLLQKQNQYLDFLARAADENNLMLAFQFLSYCDRTDLVETLLMEGADAVKLSTRKLVLQEYDKMLNKKGEPKCRIMLPKSRLIFGICDPSSAMNLPGRLREGECMVRVTEIGDGIARTVVNTEVLVTRNPCLHPGDLQKFKAVEIPEWSHLRDCIIFSTQGKRPSADLMSGGDLDGDKFFVCWDPDIVPRTVSQPAEYPAGREPVYFGGTSDADRADYFARYTNASLGRVNHLFLDWARLKGAMSPECQQLNRLFSQCVDGVGIKVPPNLEDPPKCPEKTDFVLDVLHRSAEEIIQSRLERGSNQWEGLSFGAMELLLNRDRIAMSEFELIQLTMKWCQAHKVNILDFQDFFDFCTLSDEQKLWISNCLPPSKEAPSLVWNGLLQSELVEPMELKRFQLDDHRLHWKRIFSSGVDRMGRFLETTTRTLELFHKKLIIFSVDERLTLAIYVPRKISRAQEFQVDSSVRVFALPRSQGSASTSYRVVPTKQNYRIYCDHSCFQLYENKRANTWVFLNAAASDDSTYRNTTNATDRRRRRQETIDHGVNFDCVASVNLAKISSDIQRHVGRIRRSGILQAEIYAISNRDVQSMQLLDQWLEYVDTDEILPLYERENKEYTVPSPQEVDWTAHPAAFKQIVRGKLQVLDQISASDQMRSVLELFSAFDNKTLFRDLFMRALTVISAWSNRNSQTVFATYLLEFLITHPYLITPFLQSEYWKNNKEFLEDKLIQLAPTMLRNIVLAGNNLQSLALGTFKLLLMQLKQLTFQAFADLVELIALTVRSTDLVLDMFLEALEPETSRLLVGRPLAIRNFVRNLIGTALNYVDEAVESKIERQDTLSLTFDSVQDDGFSVVKATLRIDAPTAGALKIGDHVQLTVTNAPQNSPFSPTCSIDALVLKSDLGSATFRCLHTPPNYVDKCSWTLVNCGSFVTTKSMLDAITALYTQREACCFLYKGIAGLPDYGAPTSIDKLAFTSDDTLNVSQNQALEAAMKYPLSFLWGPPGTGKTYTIVKIIRDLLNEAPKSRLLIACSSHNAVDNVLRKFITEDGVKSTGVEPVRVSTSLLKVSPDMKKYTCDAMVGKDLSSDFKGRKAAQKRVKEARLVFTTCAGASLGLLRKERFEFVLIDEASQMTEPETLIPLVKGCKRAVLVGDHVQLRATVQKHALNQEFDISLFERHYNMPNRDGVGKVMLDTQYRMHQDICAFPSMEFYAGRLHTQVLESARHLPDTLFPWPRQSIGANAPFARSLFIQCSFPEDLGQKSKSNQGQAKLCKTICELLSTPAAPSATSDAQAPLKPSIAILAPYSKQCENLKKLIFAYEISSIDGYQGREADIIIFVSVRCNNHNELGFLNDMRRLNVAMTRAKTAVIIIGDRKTLTEGDKDRESKDVWGRLLSRCVQVEEGMITKLEGC